jgi:hypothetical protein
MATPVREQRSDVGEQVRILPPEHRPEQRELPSEGAPRRAIGWIVAFALAMTALVAVAIVEEIRISDRDDAITALEQDVATMQNRIEGLQADNKDLRSDLEAALAQGSASAARVDRLLGDLAVAEKQVARLETRSATFQARAESFSGQVDKLSAALASWVPPVADGDYAGRLLGVNATADPPRIAFEAVEAENAGQWLLMPVSDSATVTVWSYPRATAEKRTEDLAFLDHMFSIDTRWSRYHQNAWYEVVVLDGIVTEIHQASPLT